MAGNDVVGIREHRPPNSVGEGVVEAGHGFVGSFFNVKVAVERLKEPLELLDDLSDDDESEVFDTRTVKLNRNREAGHDRLYRDYFADDSIYDDNDFKRRFRLSKKLFMRICSALENRYPFFQLRYDARGRRRFTTLQKCTAAIRAMAYGSSPDSLDEYLRMSERTARESMYRFSQGVLEIFGPIYLRKPTVTDVQKLYEAHEERHSFPGMLGSIDCMHWDWRNCPQSWRGEYTGGHHGVPSLILEAVASQDLWFWYAYFGVAGSNNDINVLDQSPIFNDLLSGKAPDAPFTVNGNPYRFGYFLTDGIYPRHATFVKAYRHPVDPKEVLFTKKQEFARKDVERAFGVLKAKWHIVKNAARSYDLERLRYILYACVVMHNMVVEDKGRMISPYVPDGPRHALYVPGSAEYLHRVVDIRDETTHERLRRDLADHLYNNAHADDEE